MQCHMKISHNKRKRQLYRNARSKQWQPWLAACKRKRLRFLRLSFTQRTQRKRLRLNGNRVIMLRNDYTRDQCACSLISCHHPSHPEVRFAKTILSAYDRDPFHCIDLGFYCYVDSALSFSSHVNHIVTKAKQRASQIFSALKYLKHVVVKSMFKHVQSVVTTASIVVECYCTSRSFKLDLLTSGEALPYVN